METEPASLQAKPSAPSPPKTRRSLNWKIVLGTVAVAAIGAAALESSHGTVPATAENTNAVPVAVAKVVRADLYNPMTITADFHPYLEVELHAKVSGYLSQINVDIGDRVTNGQLLATLDAPDLVAQLDSAIAAEQKAEAARTNAHLILGRLREVFQQNAKLISQQEIDTADVNDRTASANLAAARADRDKFQTLVNYLKITAPFDGVITRRHADPGALIQAGTASDTQSLPLVRLSDNYRLRLDFSVSVGHVKDIHVGDPVEVRVESLGGRVFTGVISRTAERVDSDTRTMITEIEVPNPKLDLVPGMYASVVLKLDQRPGVLAIPITAVGSGKDKTVAVVDPAGQVEERHVTLGLETPIQYEVLSGLKEGDLVVIGNRASARAGQKVEPKITEIARAE